jgi:crossover junction endodeoxyribonuclease RusA
VTEAREFWVPGRPAPQGSKRHIGNGRMVEMSKTVGPWRDLIRGRAHQAFPVPLAGPVAVTVDFVFTRPASARRTMPCVRPDLDKLIRAVLDGLTTAEHRGVKITGAFDDDGQVTQLIAVKSYGAVEGAWITAGPAGGARASAIAQEEEPCSH